MSSSSNRGNIDSTGSSSFNNRADSLVDIDCEYANADNYDYYQASRMGTAVAEQTEGTAYNNNTTTNSNDNDKFNDNYHNNYHNMSNYRNYRNTANANGTNNENHNENNNDNENDYNAMMMHTGNVAGGFRRLHRDYLRDLEDAVVLALPWPTPSDRREVSDLLRKRSVSKTRANEINACVVTYWIASIGVWLLLYYIGAANFSRRAAVTILLGLSYVVSLLVLIYGHVRYYKLDAQVQFLVRAIMDANGLGYQEQGQPRDHPLLRNDASQMPQFRLPEFVDVMLRTVVVADGGCNGNNNNNNNATNSLDDEFSAVTFRDSLMKSVTSSSAGNGTAAGAISAGAGANGTTDNAKSAHGVFSLSRRIMGYDG